MKTTQIGENRLRQEGKDDKLNRKSLITALEPRRRGEEYSWTLI